MSASPSSDADRGTAPQTLAEIEAWMAEEKLPPVDQWDPPDRGDSEMRIAADGRWFHQGREIEREKLVKLFARILRYNGEDYFLVTPVEKLRIAVEDAPFVATGLTVEGEGEGQVLVLALKSGGYVVVGEDNPVFLSGAESGAKPYAHVRGGMNAAIARPVWYELANLVTEEGGRAGVWSGGSFFPLETTGA